MEIIEIHGSINIHLDLAKTFAYLSDLRNDKSWRSEINQTIFLDNQIRVGHTVVESSFLSKRIPEYHVTLICKEFVPNAKIVYETLPENPNFLRSVRSTISLNSNCTKVNYRLSFDKSIVKHGLGFQLPTFLVRFVAKRSLGKYLKRLRHVCEGEIK